MRSSRVQWMTDGEVDGITTAAGELTRRRDHRAFKKPGALTLAQSPTIPQFCAIGVRADQSPRVCHASDAT
jgi:hypothetical protein